MRKCGIYAITNIVNNKKYIGQSINILKRFEQHKYQLRNKIHINRYLQNSWNKNGEDNFSFDILELCSVDVLDDMESKWIGEYNTLNSHCGYNIVPVGEWEGKCKNEIKNNRRRKKRLYSCSSDLYYNILEELLDNKEKVASIANTYNVTVRLVNDIKNGSFNESHCSDAIEEDVYIRKQHLYQNILKYGYDKLDIKFVNNLYKGSNVPITKFWQEYDEIKDHECNMILERTCDEIDEEIWDRKYNDVDEPIKGYLKEINEELREEYGEFAYDD